jgi:HK97 gp10 family phage protein
MGIRLRVKVEGVSEILRSLREADEKVAKKSLRQAVNEATKPVLREAKAGVPTATKSLKKSLGRKVKSYKGGRIVFALVGARKDSKGKPAKFRRQVRRSKVGKEITRNPVKYLHLVEGGTKPHSLAKGSRLGIGKQHPGARPNPFMRRANDRTKITVKSIMANTLQNALRGLKRK